MGFRYAVGDRVVASVSLRFFLEDGATITGTILETRPAPVNRRHPLYRLAWSDDNGTAQEDWFSEYHILATEAAYVQLTHRWYNVISTGHLAVVRVPDTITAARPLARALAKALGTEVLGLDNLADATCQPSYDAALTLLCAHRGDQSAFPQYHLYDWDGTSLVHTRPAIT